MLFSPFFICKRFQPVLNSPRQSRLQKEIIWDMGIRSVLILPAYNKGERGKIKWGRIFPFLQYEQLIHHIS